MKCVNNTCGKDYLENENNETVCLYHPGEPIFHEGLKGWSCCKKRTADFSEFLAFPGCTEGRHLDKKPQAETVVAEEPIAPTHHAPIEEDTKPKSDESAAVEVAITRGPSAQKAYNTFIQKHLADKAARDQGIVDDAKVCEHKGCSSTYGEAKKEDNSRCVYHSGAPVFHEGFKSWSCCHIKTSDFQEFMDQKGCSVGTHLWAPQEDTTSQTVECRTDFFQGAETLSLSVFGKHIDIENTVLKVTNHKICLDMKFEGTKHCVMDIPLYKEIDPTKTTARVGPAKLEIGITKADAGQWPQLK
ncbi:hypothetical protein SARC_03253 [Sphaeroforma arctica JP610]|uniref:Cysteine and histidine-rich domain-containing protein 1 n=1 Tax=Sphaeroforma arctica JP610 TaxID=667725 RepID=A0A0L0G690_9EUKA|nr:hypothetical protein SARC_03253 [Sphaeroforma arctica JP610]KNC84527.1 hypothetical protein SARC_03253 [Sphaeroforma arctica JP610]|eukprot:XP_014158429.1 hypothetical protein SARC_03253 [Sphaeroforma arctica JP610]